MLIAATYDFDWREHYRASRAVSRRLRSRWLGPAFAVLMFLLALFTYLGSAGRASALSVFLNILPWVLLGCFWLGMMPFMQWRAAKKLPLRDASVRGPQERWLDEAGYHSRGNSVALDIPWHAMVRAVETSDFFLFFYTKQCAYYLPKRVLTGSQIAEGRSLLEKRLGAQAELLSSGEPLPNER